MVQFFDGHRAVPHEAELELVDGVIQLYDKETTTANALVFPLKECLVSEIGERMFIYLDKGKSGAYLIVEKNNEHYTELKRTFFSMQKGWYEKLFRQKWSVLAGISVLLIGIVYMIVIWMLPFIVIHMISTKQEVLLGEKMYMSIVDEQKIDTASTRLVQAFANELSLSNQYNLQVTVVNSKEINAYALPGGHIVVYSGILRILNDPDELVGLLGHETTHINQRHSLRGMLSQMSSSLLESIVLNGLGSTGDVLLHNVNILAGLRYSRSLERDADRGGMELMLKNHINPDGMLKLMQRLQKAGHTLPSAFSFISTHPLTEERIKNANKFIAQYKSATFAENGHLMHIWEQLKKRK